MSISEFDPTNNTQHGIRPEDMPPLDETAEVPMVHSEKVNSPKYWNDKMETPAHNEKKGFGKKIAAGVAGVALLGGGLFAGSKLAGGEDSPEETPGSDTVATATQTPGASETTDPATTDTEPTTSETTEPTTTETSQDSIVEILDGVSAEEFNKYPIAARNKWLASKYKELDETGYLGDFLDQNLPDGTQLWDHSPIPEPTLPDSGLTVSSSAQDILYYRMYADQVSSAWKEDITTDGNGPLDIETAQKLVSGIYANPESKSAQLSFNAVESDPEAGRIPDILQLRSSSMVYDKADHEGNVRKHRDITYDDGDNVYTRTYAFYEVESINGDDEHGLWLTVKTERDTEE